MSVVFTHTHVRFGTRNALDGVSARLTSGAVTGIVGPNGAGKTTLLRLAAGLLPLASGACTAFDRAVSSWPRTTSRWSRAC